MLVFVYASIATDIEQNKINDKESTIVVMNGAAITAGSSLHFFAINGSKHPVILAITTVTNNASETTAERIIVYPE